MLNKIVYTTIILAGLYGIALSAIGLYQLINAAKTYPQFGVDATTPLFIMFPGIFGIIAIVGGIGGIREVKWGKVVSIVGIVLLILATVLL